MPLDLEGEARRGLRRQLAMAGSNWPGRRQIRSRYFFFLCHFLMCAALLWNFFAVAVLHAPTESPCF